jgi:hypothetical protein
MKSISRNQFLSSVFFIAIALIVSYLIVNIGVRLWAGMTFEGWKILGLVLIGLAAIKMIALLISYLYKTYILKRLSENGMATIRALNSISEVVFIGFASAMAMRAFYLERLDNVIIWGGLALTFLYRLFVELKKVNQKMESTQEDE